MEELIWFSIPGAIVLSPIFIFCINGSKEIDKFLLILIPVVGFICHQIFRTIYEMNGGWKSDEREVIRDIKEKLGNDLDSDKAFIVWELTFYSEKLPKPFREHMKSSWHLLLSFWAMSFSSFIAFVGSVFLICGKGLPAPSWVLSITLLGLVFLFLKKGQQTFDSINKEEVDAFKLYRKEFEETYNGTREKTN